MLFNSPLWTYWRDARVATSNRLHDYRLAAVVRQGDAQFSALERKTSPIGRDRVGHGPHGGDDCCNASAGAMVVALSPQPMIVSDAALAKRSFPRARIQCSGNARSTMGREEDCRNSIRPMLAVGQTRSSDEVRRVPR